MHVASQLERVKVFDFDWHENGRQRERRRKNEEKNVARCYLTDGRLLTSFVCFSRSILLDAKKHRQRELYNRSRRISCEADSSTDDERWMDGIGWFSFSSSWLRIDIKPRGLLLTWHFNNGINWLVRFKCIARACREHWWRHTWTPVVLLRATLFRSKFITVERQVLCRGLFCLPPPMTRCVCRWSDADSSLQWMCSTHGWPVLFPAIFSMLAWTWSRTTRACLAGQNAPIRRHGRPSSVGSRMGLKAMDSVAKSAHIHTMLPPRLAPIKMTRW